MARCHDPATARAVLARDEICTNGTLWLERVAPALLHQPVAGARQRGGAGGEGPLVYLSCGTNKGFGVVSFLRRYANTSFSTRDWWLALNHYRRTTHVRGSRKLGVTCGHCGACHDTAAPPLAAREVAVHAFELLYAAALLQPAPTPPTASCSMSLRHTI